MRTTKTWSCAAAVMLLVAAALATLTGCTSSTGTTTTTSTVADTTTSSTLTTAVVTTTSPTSSTTISSATTNSAPPASTTTPAVGRVPSAVTVVAASPGGGAGEVIVDWNAVGGATGYRVERASSATSTFETVAVFDITTGHATVAAGVVNLWSTGYSYVPASAGGSLPDRSRSFQYVESPVDHTRCYRVTAVNAAGRSRASAVVCSGPPS